MNIDYLVNTIIPQREKEIAEGKNLMTSQPIYVVLDLRKQFCSGHNDLLQTTNFRGIPKEYGYVDMDFEAENRDFSISNKKMKKPEEVTRFFTDHIKAFCFTIKAAHEYLIHQAHNLHNPYVYVFHSGYGNIEMDLLLAGK